MVRGDCSQQERAVAEPITAPRALGWRRGGAKTEVLEFGWHEVQQGLQPSSG